MLAVAVALTLCSPVLSAGAILPAQERAALPAPTCRATLDSLDAKTRQNYAGFLLEVRGARADAYHNMVTAARADADARTLDSCLPVLRGYAGWYDDPHLFVFQSQSADTSTARRRAAELEHHPVSERAVRSRVQMAGNAADPLEGIWYDGQQRIAVVPDAARGTGHLIGVLITSDTVAWPVGAVRARFTRQSEGAYTVDMLTRGFAHLTLDATLHRGDLLRFSPGMWGRAFPGGAVRSGYLDATDVHRPTVVVRPKSVVVSIPSHDPAHTSLLDSLVRAHAAEIESRPLLIVDVRGNEGGSSLMSRVLDPFIASREQRVTPYDSGAAVVMSSPAQMAYARRFAGSDTTAFVRDLLARMAASPGQLVQIEPGPPAPPTVVPARAGGWKVVVLVDHGTVSASEVLVLNALRSTRATVVGTNTAGALDYQSVNIVSLGTGDRRWALGYPTITAHADLPRRGMRGKGIAPDVRLDWAQVPDAIVEVERRFAP